jgi:effector-binding domain-containing protein
MTIVKRIVIILLALILLLFIISLFLPSRYSYKQKTTIEAPLSYVFDEVNDLHHWKHWDPWRKLDTTMTNIYSGSEKGEGAVRMWESESQGSGRMIILEVIPDQYIKSALYLRERQKPYYNIWKFNAIENGLELEWILEAEAGFNPLARYLFLFAKSTMDQMLAVALANLKKYVENNPIEESPGIEVDFKHVSSQSYLSKEVLVSNKEDISYYMSAVFTELYTLASIGNVRMTRRPVCFYHSWNTDTLRIECALPLAVDTDFKPDKNIKVIHAYEGLTAVASHQGNYDNIGETWELFLSFLEKEKYEIMPPVWEEYVTDPQQERDTSLWLTLLYAPVKKSR